MTLQLEGASSVSRVQVLSHEFKITRRVELFAGMPPPGAPPGELRWVAAMPCQSSKHPAIALSTV